MTSRPVRAVFWDFGGVLTSSPFEAFRRYETAHGLPPDFLRSTNALNPEHNAWAQLERNDIDVDAFDRLFAGETAARGHRVPGRDILPLLAGSLRPEMVQVLRRVRDDYRVACLTNNIATGFGPGMSVDPEAGRAVGEVMALFDYVLESSRAGVRKPERRFYEIACEALDVEPSEVVYLDDLGINLKPARELGMQTIKVGDPRAAIAELGRLLAIDFGS
ncbi:MAG: HAD-IA family hydrolase [Pseudomonadota bacterium]